MSETRISKSLESTQPDWRPLNLSASCTDCTAQASLSFYTGLTRREAKVRERATEQDFVKIMQKINYREQITKSQPLNQARMDSGIEIRRSG